MSENEDGETMRAEKQVSDELLAHEEYKTRVFRSVGARSQVTAFKICLECIY